METGYRMIYIINNGIANILSDKLKYGLGNKLPGKQDQDRRYHGLDKNDQCLIRNHLGYKRLQYDCHLKTINDQRNIISYQHGRDKQIWITIENTQYLTG